jgi:hypothetical protein
VDTIPLLSDVSVSLNLPPWVEPDGLDHAGRIIRTLGHSTHEHAYLLGKYLLWVRKNVRGKFLAWLAENVSWFSERTARNMVAHAKRCDKVGFLIEYHPNPRPATVADRPVRPRRRRWKIERSIAIFVETFLDQAAPDKELSIKIFPSTSGSSEPIAHGPGRCFARYKEKEKNYIAILETRAVSRT